ncbi:unnamed protein product [Gadus morhua 'NCC']
MDEWRCNWSAEGPGCSSDSRRVWKGFRTVTGYNSSSSSHAQSPSLPDDLICFFARFDRTDNSDNRRAQPGPSPPVLTLSPNNVRRPCSTSTPTKPPDLTEYQGGF